MSSYPVKYDGESISRVRSGSDVELFTDPEQIRIQKDKRDMVTIPTAAATETRYGQDVSRRVGAAVGFVLISFGIGRLMELLKSRKYFIRLTRDEGTG
jgi:hypothetical protein